MDQKAPSKGTFQHKSRKKHVFLKKNSPTFCCFKKKLYLCIAIEKNNGSIAQLNRAFDYGSKGYRFESYWSHSKQETNKCSSLFLFIPYKHKKIRMAVAILFA